LIYIIYAAARDLSVVIRVVWLRLGAGFFSDGLELMWVFDDGLSHDAGRLAEVEIQALLRIIPINGYFRRVHAQLLSCSLGKMESVRANGLPVIHLELNTADGSVVDHELARCSGPPIIDVKLTAASWPVVHHECTGGLRLGVAVRILLKVAIRMTLLLLNNRATSSIVDIKLAWLGCAEAHLEALLTDRFLLVKSEIIWASSIVDHELAGASRTSVVHHKLAACAGSIVNCKLIRSSTSIIYHELAAGTRAIINSKLIWATGSVVCNKFTAAR
jgi:hypothetical protein